MMEAYVFISLVESYCIFCELAHCNVGLCVMVTTLLYNTAEAVL